MFPLSSEAPRFHRGNISPCQYSSVSGYPSGVGQTNGRCPHESIWLRSPDVVVIVFGNVRNADTMRWYGRLYLAGAAAKLLGAKIVRIIDLISPPVVVYVA